MQLQVGVKVLLQNDKNEYLFIQRTVKMEGETEPHWDIPGGRIDPSEPLMDALRREIDEETGMELSGIPKLLAAQDIFVQAKDLHVVRLTYEAKGSGDVVVSDEHQKVSWWTSEQALAQNIDSYVREVLRDQER